MQNILLSVSTTGSSSLKHRLRALPCQVIDLSVSTTGSSSLKPTSTIRGSCEARLSVSTTGSSSLKLEPGHAVLVLLRAFSIHDWIVLAETTYQAVRTLPGQR